MIHSLLNGLKSLKIMWFALFLTAVSLLCMHEEIYTLMVYLTLGLALALVFVPNICAILWAKIAAGYFFPGVSNKVKWGITALIIAALATGPALFGKLQANAIMSQYKQNDSVGKFPQSQAYKSPAHIKFIYDGSYGGNASHYCDYVCQDLFLTGSVKTLAYENHILQRRGGNKNIKRVSYKISKGKGCQIEDGQKPANYKTPQRPALLDLISDGQCILKSVQSNHLPDVTITQLVVHKSDLAKANKSAPLFVDYKKMASRTITDRSDKTISSQADISLERPFLPSFFSYVSEGDRIRLGVMTTEDKAIEDSLELWAMKKLYPNISVKREHRKTIVRPSAAPRSQLVDQAIARANKVLDEAPANRSINGPQLKILSSGLQEKSYSSDRSSEDALGVNLALRILAAQRVQDVSTLRRSVIFLRRPTVTYTGDINALIFERLSKAKKHEKAVTLELLKSVPLDIRRADGAMIMRALNQQVPEDIKQSYAYAGKLGVSPISLFEKAIREYEDWTVLLPVANAIRCGDTKWRRALVPSLDKMIAQHAKGEGSRHAAAVAVWTLNHDWEMPTRLSKKHTSFKTPMSECR